MFFECCKISTNSYRTLNSVLSSEWVLDNRMTYFMLPARKMKKVILETAISTFVNGMTAYGHWKVLS